MQRFPTRGCARTLTGMASEAEREAATAKWQAVVGQPDPAALAWAREVLDRVEADQAQPAAS